MLHYFLKNIDNALMAGIALSLVWTLLLWQNPRKCRSFFITGLFIGFIPAIIYAYLKRTTGYAVREYYDLFNLGILLFLFIGFLVLSFIQSRVTNNFIYLLYSIILSLLTASWIAYSLPNIVLYPFEFAVGEASFFTVDVVYKLAGYSLGLLFVFVLGILIHKLTKRFSKRQMIVVILSVFFVLFLQNLMEILQILIGRNLIYRHPVMVRWVIILLNYKNFFLYSLIIILLVSDSILWFKARTFSLIGKNPAEQRKIRSEQNTIKNLIGFSILFFSFLIFSISYLKNLSQQEINISPPKEVFAVNEVITIPLQEVSDGQLHRFGYKTNSGTQIRFIIIKKNLTAYGVGLDACDICGASGYYQRGDQVVCKLCDVAINISTIGFSGGCNPVPLEFSINEGHVSIDAHVLESESRRFE